MGLPCVSGSLEGFKGSGIDIPFCTSYAPGENYSNYMPPLLEDLVRTEVDQRARGCYPCPLLGCLAARPDEMRVLPSRIPSCWMLSLSTPSGTVVEFIAVPSRLLQFRSRLLQFRPRLLQFRSRLLQFRFRLLQFRSR